MPHFTRLAAGTAALLVAALLGYTARNANTVFAQSGQSHSRTTQPGAEDALSFQLSELGPRTGLTVYNAQDHTLYVYGNVTDGNSRINCTYALHIARPGGPLERQNCSVGSAF